MASVQNYCLRWAGLDIEIRYCPDWLPCYAASYGYALARLEVIAAGRAAMPISATGYCSCFDRADNIDAAGGPVAFVDSWLNEAAHSPEWTGRQACSRQLSLL